MNRARGTEAGLKTAVTSTPYQRRRKDASGVIDLTRARLAKYVADLRNPRVRAEAAALVSRYDAADIEVAWRSGRPIWKKG